MSDIADWFFIVGGHLRYPGWQKTVSWSTPPPSQQQSPEAVVLVVLCKTQQNTNPEAYSMKNTSFSQSRINLWLWGYLVFNSVLVVALEKPTTDCSRQGRLELLMSSTVCKQCNLTCGVWKVGRASKGWGSCWQTRDKGGWVFAIMSKEVGSQSK